MNRLIIAFFAALVLVCTSFRSIPDSNVTTITTTVNPAGWKLIGKPGNRGSYASDTIKCPAISEDVFNNGAVLVYILGTSGGGWYLLPHKYYASGMEYNFNYRPGYVEIRSYFDNGTLQAPKQPFNFKVVVMQGQKP